MTTAICLVGPLSARAHSRAWRIISGKSAWYPVFAELVRGSKVQNQILRAFSQAA